MSPVTATWWGPLGLEGQKTGDGRTIDLNALSWGEFPLPLRWAPADFGAHDGATVVGRILGISRDSKGVIVGHGDFDMESEAGREAHRHVSKGLTPGVSMDLDDIVITETEDSQDLSITQGRIRGATLVAIPAFADARLSSIETESMSIEDDDPEVPEADVVEAISLANEESDGTFNWVDDAGGLPKYIKRIAAHIQAKGADESRAIATAVNVVKKMCATGDVNFPGAQQVNAASRAEACAAVAEWEAKKAKAKASSADSLVAAAYPRNHFDDPRLDAPTPLTVDDDGHVYGHIALWGTCHIAFKGCTQPPNSPSNYAYFNTHEVSTTDGRRIAVGRLTMNTLHAGQRLSANDTVYHYEHTGAVGAYVRAGEDRHGIWVSGVAHPKADIDSLRAAPVSGDWRRIGSGLELVGLLSVNVPGFPVPRAQALVASGDIVMSLVAGGMNTKERRTTLAIERVKAMVFGYNEDQWRVPKGNGKISGRWMDMPNLSIDLLESDLMDLADKGIFDDEPARQVGESMVKAQIAGEKIADALRAGDGETAKEGAAEASEALGMLETQLQDVADDGSGRLDDNLAASLGEKLNAARDSVELISSSDLSLLGDKGIGGDDEGADIGAPDAPDAKAEGTDIGADEPDIDAGPVDAADAMTDLESKVYGMAETAGLSDEQATDMGAALQEAISAVDNGDFAKADESLSLLEAQLQDYADNAPDLDENQIADIGDALAKAREAVSVPQPGNTPNDPGAANDPPNPADDAAALDVAGVLSKDLDGQDVSLDIAKGAIETHAKDIGGNPKDAFYDLLDSWINGDQTGDDDLDQIFETAEANEFTPEEVMGALGLGAAPGEGPGSAEIDPEAENVWKGFEDKYLATADPENDIDPDTLREKYDGYIKSGELPSVAIGKIAKDVQDNRSAGAEADAKGDIDFPGVNPDGTLQRDESDPDAWEDPAVENSLPIGSIITDEESDDYEFKKIGVGEWEVIKSPDGPDDGYPVGDIVTGSDILAGGDTRLKVKSVGEGDVTGEELAGLNDVVITYDDGVKVPLKRNEDGLWVDPDGETYTDEDVSYGVGQQGGTIAPADAGGATDAEIADSGLSNGDIDFPGVNPDGSIDPGEDEYDSAATVVNALPIGSIVTDDQGYKMQKTGEGEWTIIEAGPETDPDFGVGETLGEGDLLAGGDAVLKVAKVGDGTAPPPEALTDVPFRSEIIITL